MSTLLPILSVAASITAVSALYSTLIRRRIIKVAQKEMDLATIYKKLTKLEYRRLLLKKFSKLNGLAKIDEYLSGISYLINKHTASQGKGMLEVEINMSASRESKELQSFYGQFDRAPKDVKELCADFSDILVEIYKIKRPFSSFLIDLKKMALVRILGFLDAILRILDKYVAVLEMLDKYIDVTTKKRAINELFPEIRVMRS